MKRLEYIDNLRGFAILLVVLGHVIQYLTCPLDFDNNTIFRHIYCFHMPLFFFLSGFVTPVRKTYLNIELYRKIKKRFCQLIIPFFLWKLIIWIPFGQSPLFNLFLHPDSGLWFLWVLFFVILLFYISLIISTYTNLKGWIVLIVICLACRLALSNYSLLGIDMISRFSPFFIAGAIACQIKEVIPCIKLKYRIAPIVLLLLAYLLCSNFWYRYGCLPSDSTVLLVGINHIPFFSEFTAFSGILLTVLLFSFYNKNGILTRAGQISLGIYAIHQSLLWIYRVLNPTCNPVSYTSHSFLLLDIVFCFIIVLLLTLAIYKILANYKYSSICLLGNVN